MSYRANRQINEGKNIASLTELLTNKFWHKKTIRLLTLSSFPFFGCFSVALIVLDNKI